MFCLLFKDIIETLPKKYKSVLRFRNHSRYNDGR